MTIYTLAALSSIAYLIAFIYVLIFLYKNIKAESGKWTAMLVILIAYVMISSITPPFPKHENKPVFSEECQNCILKKNASISIIEQISLLQRLNIDLQINIAEVGNEIKIINQSDYTTGLSAGFDYKINSIRLKKMSENIISYKVLTQTRVKIFGIIPWAWGLDFSGETEINKTPSYQ